jgi:hypothetical protein
MGVASAIVVAAIAGGILAGSALFAAITGA